MTNRFIAQKQKKVNNVANYMTLMAIDAKNTNTRIHVLEDPHFIKKWLMCRDSFASTKCDVAPFLPDIVKGCCSNNLFAYSLASVQYNFGILNCSKG